MEPIYKHDCSYCEFKGHIFGHDIYTCMYEDKITTIVARYGDDGPEYAYGTTVMLNYDGVTSRLEIGNL